MSWIREPNAEPIPGYRLIEPLGSGGFGEVWKCEAPGGLNKAIKFVYGNLNSLDVDCIRAEQEMKSLNRIKEVRHPFVCSLDRIEVVDGELVIVMELADRTLHDLFVECQAAGIAHVSALEPFFPIFRAHPLLFQFTLSLFYHFGASDLMARLLAVAFGLGTVYLAYRVGLELYGPQAGALSGLFMALMPYHVVVSR